MPRGNKKQTPAIGSTKRFQKREELCPVRKEDHLAVLAGTWKDPNGDPRPESRDPFSVDRSAERYGDLHGKGVTGRRSLDGQIANLCL